MRRRTQGPQCSCMLSSIQNVSACSSAAWIADAIEMKPAEAGQSVALLLVATQRPATKQQHSKC